MPTRVSAPASASVAVQFALTGLVWGSSFLFIAVALTGMTPAQVVWARLVCGAIALTGIVLVRREPLPRARRVWGHLLVVSLSFCIAPYLLFAWAQQHVPSGLASIFNATTPIMTAIIAWGAFRVERLRPGQIVGIGLGIAGVVVIIAPGAAFEIGGSVVAQLALLGATACYGFSLAYQRKYLAASGLSGPAFAFGYIGPAAALMLLLTPLVFLEPPRLDLRVIGSVLLLGCLGTGVAYVWMQNTIRAWGPTRASTVTYITPVVGVLLGILVLGERLTWNEPVGAGIVLLGILLVQGRVRIGRAARRG